MKPVICPDCSGSGEWECDEAGNMYKHPIKCDSCKREITEPLVTICESCLSFEIV